MTADYLPEPLPLQAPNFGRLGYPEFQRLFGRNLNLLAGLGIASGAGFPIDDNELTNSRHAKLILRVFICQSSQCVQYPLNILLLNMRLLGDSPRRAAIWLMTFSLV